jgi:hypothetical protein
MIVCGENDFANRQSADILHDKIANSNLSIVCNAGHEVNKDMPEELATILVEYLQ